MENLSCKEMLMNAQTKVADQPIIDVRKLSFSYHSMEEETLALSDVSFRVYPGEFLSIVGPSGCGKTTLLSLIAGLIPVEQGDIIKTQDLKTGYMLQRDLLLEWRTIWENVMLGLEINHAINETTKQYAMQLLKEYGLEEFIHKKPSA